jgi:hypothetical protein
MIYSRASFIYIFFANVIIVFLGKLMSLLLVLDSYIGLITA